MRDRRAEHGHDGVADELLEVASERLDGSFRRPVIRLEGIADVLRITVVRAPGEADQIDEEHGHDLALLPCLACQRSATCPTESGALGVLFATASAAH